MPIYHTVGTVMLYKDNLGKVSEYLGVSSAEYLEWSLGVALGEMHGRRCLLRDAESS